LNPEFVPVPTAQEKIDIQITDEISTRNTGTRWAQGEEALLFYLYAYTENPLAKIAGLIGRSAFALRAHLRKLGVNPAPMTEEEAEETSKEPEQ